MIAGILRALSLGLLLVRYNIKIVFAQRFLYFLFAAMGLFAAAVLINRAAGKELTPSTLYDLLLLPGILLVFYPAVFGIQSDSDARMLEMIFGIPDYRYKVWLFRLLLSIAVAEAVLFCLCCACAIFYSGFPIVRMSMQIFFAVVFWSGTAFACSTLMRSAYGAAVLLILAGFLLWVAGGSLAANQWNVFLNPFDAVSGAKEMTWHATVRANRILLAAAGMAGILWGMRNLTAREKFLA
ncbi:MAG TPA: hypothetical protein VLX68_02280 [Chitinivibrionales bacterium]|nr:hypothetical protein [Chitinivibrionales bacterium]